MNELIKTFTQKIGTEEINSVTARELYLGLGLAPSQYSRWIIVNIENNEFFTQGVDFVKTDIMSHPISGFKC